MFMIKIFLQGNRIEFRDAHSAFAARVNADKYFACRDVREVRVINPLTEQVIYARGKG